MNGLKLRISATLSCLGRNSTISAPNSTTTSGLLFHLRSLRHGHIIDTGFEGQNGNTVRNSAKVLLEGWLSRCATFCCLEAFIGKLQTKIHPICCVVSFLAASTPCLSASLANMLRKLLSKSAAISGHSCGAFLTVYTPDKLCISKKWFRLIYWRQCHVFNRHFLVAFLPVTHSWNRISMAVNIQGQAK